MDYGLEGPGGHGRRAVQRVLTVLSSGPARTAPGLSHPLTGCNRQATATSVMGASWTAPFEDAVDGNGQPR
ncbi:hypothetical protein DPMN_148122 [Dreissena polymorpha]|uniref:Uncharacterized protein n=1 Tax=Dreissena polymorpha TaxID=45954 RepID=A0A9D4J186_DREPO|nr:hypothetical protein DPMN_148122 [Dreissena polymorpha]